MRIALLLLGLSACTSSKLLRLENEVLKAQNKELRGRITDCDAAAGPEDFAVQVDVDLVAAYLARAGMEQVERTDKGVLQVPIEGRNTRFVVSLQLFERERVLFMATSEYLQLEDATSSSAMVLLLTRLATLNYDLLLGKFQLNTRTGEIALSVELNLDDGLGYKTFEAVLHHLVRTADERWPELVRAARGQGL